MLVSSYSDSKKLSFIPLFFDLDHMGSVLGECDSCWRMPMRVSVNGDARTYRFGDDRYLLGGNLDWPWVTATQQQQEWEAKQEIGKTASAQ